MMRYIILVCILGLSPSPSDSICPENRSETPSPRKLIIKGDPVFPPYEYINDQGEPDGFNVELTIAIMNELGVPYELSLENWSKAREECMQGKVDLLTGMMYSNNRAKDFKFGAIHTFVYLNIVFRKGEKPISELSGLKGKSVIVQKGAITEEILREEVPQAIPIIVEELYTGLRMLSEGKYDVAMCNQEMARSIIYKKGFSNLDMIELQRSPEEYCFASTNDSLLSVVDNAFYRLKRNGTYDRIYNKWFSIPTEKNIPKWLYISLVILFVVTVIFYLFIYLLKKKIRIANAGIKQENTKLSLAIKGSNMVFWEFNRLTKKFRVYNDPINDYNDSRPLSIEDYYQCMNYSDVMTLKPYSELMCEGRDESYSVDVKIKTKHDVEWRYCTINCIPFEKDPDTCKIIRYIGFRRDNTELVELNKEMNEYAQKMRYVLHYSNILVWNYDIHTQTISLDYGDKALQKQITVNEFILNRVPPAKQKAVQEFLTHLSKGKEENFSIQWELLPVQKDDNRDIRYVMINGMPLRDHAGNIIAYSGLRRDITNLILTQNKLKHETERALQADKLKSAFLANMSHEIRTPLNAIVGFSNILQETKDPRERAEYAHLINMNNELLLNLINDILDLSRIESGEMTLNRENFDLATHFDSVVSSLQQRPHSPNIEFIIENPYKSCQVCLDRNRITQIFTNFVTNAIKHTSEGFIRIGYVYTQEGIRIYVEDTGSGIPLEKHHLVFQRFEKLNPFVQGTGLGLSICKAIVDACKGEIDFTSNDGHGSYFWAWIPCNANIILKEKSI